MSSDAEARERAAKVRPEYTGGELVKAASAQNQAEAELIQGLLLEQGIPSVERRTRGFDVPDFLAAGPRDVLVPSAAASAARELLEGAGVGAHDSNGHPTPTVDRDRALRLAVGLLLALLLAAGLVLALYEIST